MKYNSIVKAGMFLIILSIAIAFLVIAKNVLFPIVMSTFFAYLLYPVVWRVERWGVHRALAAFLVILVVVIILAAGVVPFSIQASNLSLDYAEMKEQFDTKAESIQAVFQQKFHINANTMDDYTENLGSSIISSWQNSIGNLFSATTTTLFQIGMLPVFTFFLLFYRTKMAYFIFRAVGRKRKPKALTILKEISTLTSKYLGGVLIVVVILAVLNSLGLFIIGVKHALVMGVLAALLNLIPYFGTLLGGLIPFLYVYFTVPDPFNMMLKVVILFLIVQFFENNILTPNIVGNSIKMNPFAVILSLLFANLVWGVAGMLVVVPSLAILKVIMRNIEELRPYAYLISDRGMEKHQIGYNIFSKNKKK